MSKPLSKPLPAAPRLPAAPSYWRFVRAVFAADEKLSAEESASTLFRFFRSDHVIDLRLIARLALFALAFYFIALLVFGGTTISSLWDLGTSSIIWIRGTSANYYLPAFVIYIALLGWPLRTAERRLGVADLWSITGFTALAFMAYVVIVVVVSEIYPPSPDSQLGSSPTTTAVPPNDFAHTLATYFGPAIPVCGAVVAWAYLSATKRLGVVDLFACEIRTLCRVGTVFDIGTVYVDLYNKTANAEKPLVERHSSGESKEEYFPVFSDNSRDLEALEATVVGNITEFYTYMKAARDLQRKLENEPAKFAKPILENLIYVLFLGYESARKAIMDLIEFQPARAENIIVVLLTELPCYAFLRHHFKDKEESKLRWERLQLRETDYMDEVTNLALQVSRHANERDWIAAEKSMPELGKRYKAALGEDLQQTMLRAEEGHKLRTKRAALLKPNSTKG